MKRKIPPSVQSGLKKLGSDIKKARLRRGIKMALLAERAGISIETLAKIQRGHPGVSMGHYAMVIFGLGMGTDWMNLASIKNDIVGQFIDDSKVPMRARDKKEK